MVSPSRPSRQQRWIYPFTLALSCIIVVLRLPVKAELDATQGWHQAAMDNLGVRTIKPIFAIVPMTIGKRSNVTVTLTVWLRRIGAAKGACDLPHQAKDAIRMMVWVDDPADLKIRKYGHLWLPVEHHVWQPRLRLETNDSGPALLPVLETTPEQLSKVPEPPLRPYAFRIDLPDGVGNCFKIYEESFGRFKHAICLPPTATDNVCATLAPAHQHTAATPALWMVIGPVRHTDSPRHWSLLHAHIAQRLEHYLTYHVAMGASGLLLYADELTRGYLHEDVRTAAMLRTGTLRFIHWDLREREHEDDGRGRILGYNYDQALVAGHAFLGLSACGMNLMLLMTDLDEYLYTLKPGNRWPLPLDSCMPRSSGGQGPIAMYILPRTELLSTKYIPAEESALWVRNASGPSSQLQSQTVSQHPLQHYDSISRKPMKSRHNKPITVPASEIVAFFVHEGATLRLPEVKPVDADCLMLLHLPNYFRHRTTHVTTYVKLNMSDFRAFEHWMFAQDGGTFFSSAFHTTHDRPAEEGRLSGLPVPFITIGCVLAMLAMLLIMIMRLRSPTAPGRRWRQ